MIITVQKNFIVLTAETMEDAAKLAEASLLLRQFGREVNLLAYRTIEIPLAEYPKPEWIPEKPYRQSLIKRKSKGKTSP